MDTAQGKPEPQPEVKGPMQNDKRESTCPLPCRAWTPGPEISYGMDAETGAMDGPAPNEAWTPRSSFRG